MSSLISVLSLLLFMSFLTRYKYQSLTLSVDKNNPLEGTIEILWVWKKKSKPKATMMNVGTSTAETHSWALSIRVFVKAV